MTRSPRTGARRAFTLIELVVVLVLMGLIFGVTAPAFIAQSDSDDASSPALALLRSARATALRQAVRVDVTLDPRSGRVWVRADRATPTLDSTWTLERSEGTEFVAAGDRLNFTFLPGGTAWGDTLFVQSAAGTQRISLDSRTGDPHADAGISGAPGTPR